MAFDIGQISQSKPKAIREPERFLIYSKNGKGKSSICAPTIFGPGAENPIYMNMNNGIAHLPVAGNNYLINTYDKAVDFLQQVYSGDHNFKELVIDMADDLERIIGKKIADDHNKKDIDSMGYNEGYALLTDEFRRFCLNYLDRIRIKRQMKIIFLAGTEIKKDVTSDGKTFESISPLVYGSSAKGVSNLSFLRGWVDAVFYLADEPKLYQDQTTKRNRPKGDRQYYIYTCEIDSIYAKNRYNMPEKIDASCNAWQNIMHHIDQFWINENNKIMQSEINVPTHITVPKKREIKPNGKDTEFPEPIISTSSLTGDNHEHA
jgi:hypothetical protein